MNQRVKNIALLKRGELLGKPVEANQQPSRVRSDNVRDTKGSETTLPLKEGSARAPRAIQI